MKLNECINKVCCLYASDWHLAVMLLPYINKKIQEKNKIYMKFENSIEEKIQILIDKMELKNKNFINEIKWNENIQDEEMCENEKIYIISGNEEFIEEKNNMIQEYYQNKDEKIKIINCYEINENSSQIDIIRENNYKTILNTNGERVIC
ncbi:MAG: hypothetical protein J6J36_09290 [Clostridia bacterium]|nr:hypothetical protein [Clostridia bacterium]